MIRRVHHEWARSWTVERCTSTVYRECSETGSNFMGFVLDSGHLNGVSGRLII